MSQKYQNSYSAGIHHQLRQGLSSNNFHKAIHDIKMGWINRDLWINMGWQEIRQRYRRSRIGPFWLTISMGVMVLALGVLYGEILNVEVSKYIPYLASGFVIWGFISGMIQDVVGSFIRGEGLIKQLPAPFSIHVYRAVWVNLIILAHNIVIFFIVSIWFGKLPSLTMLLALPAIILIMLNGVWFGLLFGLLSARFRDIPQIIASLLQLMFFITPIFWTPEMVPQKTYILDLNPFYYFVEIVRAPLLGYIPNTFTVLGALIITIIGWGLALFIFTPLRWRIPYWV